jgi:hypothetical protein
MTVRYRVCPRNKDAKEARIFELEGDQHRARHLSLQRLVNDLTLVFGDITRNSTHVRM